MQFATIWPVIHMNALTQPDPSALHLHLLTKFADAVGGGGRVVWAGKQACVVHIVNCNDSIILTHNQPKLPL
jgi:hypothetical protein